MAFESLSERLQNAIKMFRGTKEITEEDLKEPLRQVRMALLEADVNFKVAKNFVAKIKERALGAEIQQNLSPSQQIIKIVDEELTALLGGTQAKLTVADKPPTIIMLVGLQGTGKTTTVGKLAYNLKKKKKSPLLVLPTYTVRLLSPSFRCWAIRLGYRCFPWGTKCHRWKLPGSRWTKRPIWPAIQSSSIPPVAFE